MYWPVVLLLSLTSRSYAQLTAQSSVAPDLRECYTDPTLLNRNNLPPTAMNVLIDIIQKIEDNPNVNMDLRQIAAAMLHTYRQDGIEYHQPETNLGTSANFLPFAPTFHSFHRHKLLLTNILPSNQIFANTTLNSVLKCTLHHMLSTTVDARVRGDENSCNQLSQYRALRTIRQAPSVKDDVEVMEPGLVNLFNKMGHVRQYNPNNDVEYTSYGDTRSERQLVGESQCPILDGVVKTVWGAVSAGHLIAGIAAGAQLQQILLTDLVRTEVLTNYVNMPQRITSIYPATLSGDLAEAVLIQGTERGNPTISIGTAGSWNSSQATKHYMLHSRTNVQMTDPEIRGDIDGFVLGTTFSSVQGIYSSLKLSQLLDMYYSPRNGVFSSSLRACNRLALSQQYITNTNLISETYAFTAALDANMPLRGTITGGMDEFVTSAVTNFQTYATSNLNDLSCVNSETTMKDYRLKTNLYIVLDASWQYRAVYPAISYLLDTIEVNKFGSSVTLLSALDGSVIVNKTFSLADFHSNYTQQKHESLLTGVNLQTSMTNIRIMMQQELNNEKTSNYVGGNSTVLLYLLNTGNLQNNEVVTTQARILNETVPDLRVLFATTTNQHDTLWNLVRDMNKDIMTISLSNDGTNVELALSSVLERIQSAGRRIVNSNCGSDYVVESTSGMRSFDDYVDPGYINFYSISPNYFYQNNDNRKVRITRNSAGAGSLVVCQSRVVAQPRQNSTNLGVDEGAIFCQSLTGNGNVEISLQNACDSYWTINSCPSFYISVQSVLGTGVDTFTATCTDVHCRFPYSLRYQVQIEEFGCFSGAGSITASLIITLAALFISVTRI